METGDYDDALLSKAINFLRSVGVLEGAQIDY
jgi:hypothetical protein